MGFGKILREPLLKLIPIFCLASLNLWKRLTYTRIYLMWFSQLLQEKDDTTIQIILSECQNLQMLQEIGFRGNPYKITQSMKSTVLQWGKVLFLKAEELKFIVCCGNIKGDWWKIWGNCWLARFTHFPVIFQNKIVEREKREFDDHRFWKKSYPIPPQTSPLDRA